MSAPRRCSGLRGSLDGIGSQEGRGLLKAISFQLLSRQSSAVSNLGNGNAGWIGIGIGGEWMDEKDAYFFSHAADMGAVQCSTACTVDHSTMMMAVTFSLVSLSDEGHPTRIMHPSGPSQQIGRAIGRGGGNPRWVLSRTCLPRALTGNSNTCDTIS